MPRYSVCVRTLDVCILQYGPARPALHSTTVQRSIHGVTACHNQTKAEFDFLESSSLAVSSKYRFATRTVLPTQSEANFKFECHEK